MARHFELSTPFSHVSEQDMLHCFHTSIPQTSAEWMELAIEQLSPNDCEAVMPRAIAILLPHASENDTLRCA
jgi:hypothetical protein